MSRFSAVFSFALILLAPATCRYLSVSDVRGKGAPIPSKIILPFPNKGPIPSAFDWRNVSGKRYTTGAFDQMKPSLCGSCWAHAASGALSDRYKIATGGLAGEINISPQGLLDCSADANDNATYAGSCNGGNPTLAYDSISKLGESRIAPVYPILAKIFRIGLKFHAKIGCAEHAIVSEHVDSCRQMKLCGLTSSSLAK